MEMLTLLLMVFTVSGFSYRLTFTQIDGQNRDDPSGLRNKELQVPISAEVRKDGEENIAVESTEMRKTDEQRGEGNTPETNCMSKPVRGEKTVEEIRGDDGPTSQTDPEKQMTEEKAEWEMTKTRTIEKIFDRNQDGVQKTEEGHTPKKFFTSILLQEQTKREIFSVPDTVEYVDTDSDVVKMRENGQNLVPTSNTEMRDESRMLTDTGKNWKVVKSVRSYDAGTLKEAKNDKTDVKSKRSDQIERVIQDIVEEERKRKLVAGISLHQTTGDTHVDAKILTQKIRKEIGEKGQQAEKREGIEYANKLEKLERERDDQKVVNNLPSPLSTFSAQVGKELVIPATVQINTQSQNPPPYQTVFHPHPVTPTQIPPDSSHPPTPYSKVSFRLYHPSVNIHIPKSVSHITDLTMSPRRHLKLKEMEAKAGSVLEDAMVKNVLLNPAWKEIQTHPAEDKGEINRVVQPDEGEFIFLPQTATTKPKEEKFITKDPNPTSKSKDNVFAQVVKPVHISNMTQQTGRQQNVDLMENYAKLAAKQNKASPPQPQLKNPSAKPQLTTAKTPSVRPMKNNKRSKTKTIKKSKEKRRKKNNKAQKPPKEKKETSPPVYFPYFMDNYCPTECVCYGRVVQCSDQGVDKIPYGIPYNARYILLMNNHINSIQLDLLNQYVSMEFLVLSNNRLTDGSIEGAFDGVPALKRLYLDRNLLESVPTDLPGALEELRLDNNRLTVMSEAAWTQCPGLLVLSLRNNTLGSESLPNAVLSPLTNLRTLNLDHNMLTSVPLGLPLSIKELYLKGNLLEQFSRGTFGGKSGLMVLDLSSNRLTNEGFLRDSFLNVPYLESLNLEGNRLKQVPRYLPPSLKTLNLEGNRIFSIKKSAFRSLKKLEHLGLARNKIFKVAFGAFRMLPVLHQLDLCHNSLHHVPRQLPKSLHLVALTKNKIQSVPHDAFCWGDESLSALVQVQLENNLIDMTKLDAYAFRCLRGFQVVHFY